MPSRVEADRYAPDRARTGRRRATVTAVVAVGGVLLLAWLTRAGRSGAPPGADSDGGTGSGSTVVGERTTFGGVDGCRRSPEFVAGLGLAGQPALATSLTNVKGLAILHGDPAAPQVYVHETWDDAGFLGPFITDRHGHIFTAPVPLVSLDDNPPELQNRVYRVDTATQTLSLFAELPGVPAPPGGNPYGTVGLAYDCDTESLYATSLAGSTATAELGRIYQIDLPTARIVGQLDGVDAVGAGVFAGVGGKRLYYGSARRPEVASIALDDRGAFVGAPRREIALGALVRAGRDTVRRIRFVRDEMTLSLMDFTYSLQAAGERQEDVLILVYDAARDAWTPQEGVHGAPGTAVGADAQPDRRSQPSALPGPAKP